MVVRDTYSLTNFTANGNGVDVNSMALLSPPPPAPTSNGHHYMLNNEESQSSVSQVNLLDLTQNNENSEGKKEGVFYQSPNVLSNDSHSVVFSEIVIIFNHHFEDVFVRNLNNGFRKKNIRKT